MTDILNAINDVSAALTEFRAENQQRLDLIESQHRQFETELARGAVLGQRPAAPDAAAQARIDAMVREFQRVEPGIGVEEVRAYGKQFGKYLAHGLDGLSGEERERQRFGGFRAEGTVGSDPEGGFNVPPDTAGRIAELIKESSPIRQIAFIETTRRDRKSGINDLDESGGGWVGETESRSDTTTPEIGKWEIPLRELYAQPKATQTQIDTADDAEAFFVRHASRKLARLEATAFVNGDGVAKPRGFLTYAAGTPSKSSWNVIEQSDTGVNGDFHATLPGDVFQTIIGTLKADYLANARWVMNRTTLAAVRRIKDGDGTYLLSRDFTRPGVGMILGYPITLAEDMPAMATDSLSIAFGDFRAAYTILDHLAGIRVLRDPFTDKPFVKFYTTQRVGGACIGFEALKLIKFAA